MSDGTRTTECSLLSLAEAQARVRAFLTPIAGTEQVPLAAASGRILARPVAAEVPLPRFDNAAVDGYAVNSRLLSSGSPPFTLPVVHRLIAGAAPGLPATATATATGAVRIFTGSPLPPGYDAVVMQEQCEAQGGNVVVLRQPAFGDNVRRSGEDVADGEFILDAGLRLDARHLALAAAIGLSHLSVHRRLRAAVFSTGNELRAAGSALQPAAIYDSNRPMLLALLAAAGATTTDAGILPDDSQHLATAVRALAQQHDLLVSSGGISVGDEDHVSRLIREHCHRHARLWMAVKPGKPAMLGLMGQAAWLGLPGNAFAAFVAFLILGRPAIESLSGHAGASAPIGRPAVAAFRWCRKPGREEFFPVRHAGFDTAGLPMLEKLGRGGSARLRPLVDGDGLAMVAAEVVEVTPGSRLTYLPFDAMLIA